MDHHDAQMQFRLKILLRSAKHIAAKASITNYITGKAADASSPFFAFPSCNHRLSLRNSKVREKLTLSSFQAWAGPVVKSKPLERQHTQSTKGPVVQCSRSNYSAT